MELEDVQALINDQLGKQAAAHAEELAKLRTELEIAKQEAAARTIMSPTPLNTIPAHGAGPGTENRPTWSQWEQQLAILAAETVVDVAERVL